MSLLEQIRPSSQEIFLSPVQRQVDGLVEGFLSQAADWRNLSAMMAAGMSYRLGKIGVMSARVGTLCEAPLRFASIAVGLGSEAAAFEMAHRSLFHLTGEGIQNQNLWKWQGRGGLQEGWLSSLITFGTLKGLGRVTQGQNLILQHGVQDLGMVLGHQMVYQTGTGSAPEGTLAQQLLRAEATNLQVCAGAALGHGLTAGRLYDMERGQEPAFSADRSQRGSALETLLGKVLPQATTVPVFHTASGLDVRAPLGAGKTKAIGENPREGALWMNISTEQGLLIAAGVLSATAVGSWLVRTLFAERKDPYSSETEFLYVLSRKERKLLKPFFSAEVPKKIRLEDWEKINQRVYDEACDVCPRPGKRFDLNIKNQSLYDLYLRIVDAKWRYIKDPSTFQQMSGGNSQERKKDIPSGTRVRLHIGVDKRVVPVKSEQRVRREQETLLDLRPDSVRKKGDPPDEKSGS